MKYFYAFEEYGYLNSISPWRCWTACRLNNGEPGVICRGRAYGCLMPF